ncbi:hypothetical protein Hs30E_10200 [Lactococcus hodotermopsidis]|uniref:ABC-2 type transporter transmembrane domain-containing protein n=1 Tax=Pseudolactococcus hodotermopsidis TaxID=2709157 RepID=A0A6A0BAL1_9LACT|nr:ABC transporter permease [Lactococcus hodotermopsidis]GFH42469.1 hypothetical protein Hs30E_10200 [Lactococcus hodotermopsidis]
MTVFKGFMLLFKRNIAPALLYLLIFIGMAIMSQAAGVSNSQMESFKSEKIRIALVDKDQSTLSKSLVTYLEMTQEVVDGLELTSKAKIQETIYYREVYCVIQIPKGFEQDYLNKQIPLKIIESSENESLYVTNQVNTFLNDVNILYKSGYTVAKAVEKVKNYEKNEAAITLKATNKNGGKLSNHSSLFQIMPFVMISMSAFSVGMILILYEDSDRKRRILCAPVSYRSMNKQLMLGVGVIGSGLWLLCAVILPLVLNGKSFLVDANLPYYLLNLALLTLVCLSLSFLLSKLIKRPEIISNIVNSLALGMSFLGGVFIPLSMLSTSVKMFSKFLPVYWYEVTNQLIGYHTKFNQTQRLELCKGYGMQLLFVLAFLSLAMLIGKLREQEN